MTDIPNATLDRLDRAILGVLDTECRTADEVANQLSYVGIDPPENLTQLLAILSGHGLVRRNRGRDRMIRWRRTDDGAKAVRR